MAGKAGAYLCHLKVSALIMTAASACLFELCQIRLGVSASRAL